MVDRDGLENRCACKRTVGSNPTLSANTPKLLPGESSPLQGTTLPIPAFPGLWDEGRSAVGRRRHVRFAQKATVLMRGSEMTRWARSGNQLLELWVIAPIAKLDALSFVPLWAATCGHYFGDGGIAEEW